MFIITLQTSSSEDWSCIWEDKLAVVFIGHLVWFHAMSMRPLLSELALPRKQLRQEVSTAWLAGVTAFHHSTLAFSPQHRDFKFIFTKLGWRDGSVVKSLWLLQRPKSSVSYTRLRRLSAACRSAAPISRHTALPIQINLTRRERLRNLILLTILIPFSFQNRIKFWTKLLSAVCFINLAPCLHFNYTATV